MILENSYVLRMALAQLRWLAFGECRTEGWDGPPPTAKETENALLVAIENAAAQEDVNERESRLNVALGKVFGWPKGAVTVLSAPQAGNGQLGGAAAAAAAQPVQWGPCNKCQGSGKEKHRASYGYTDFDQFTDCIHCCGTGQKRLATTTAKTPGQAESGQQPHESIKIIREIMAFIHSHATGGFDPALAEERVNARLDKIETALSEFRLQYLLDCFECAIDEGLYEALAETTDERLKDLLERRIMYGYDRVNC